MELILKQDKNSKELEDFFNKIIPKIPGVVTKKMFGHPAAFVNDYMFMGVHSRRITLKLSESDRDDFLKLKSTMLFECTPGKIWKEYVEITGRMFNDSSALKEWIMRSFSYISSLPPKKKKVKK
jgi:TfoX/Sxy family transcriptional regulator of competence genes